MDEQLTDRGQADAACAVVLEVLRPVIVAAHVDVHTDYSSEMPDAVRRAEDQLAAVGQRRRKRFGDNRMDVVVTRRDPEWLAVETYASWSINVELEGVDGQHLGTFHDCGYSIVADLDDDEVDAVRTRLSGVAPVVPLAEIRARRRHTGSDSSAGLRRTWLRRRHPSE